MMWTDRELTTLCMVMAFGLAFVIATIVYAK